MNFKENIVNILRDVKNVIVTIDTCITVAINESDIDKSNGDSIHPIAIVRKYGERSGNEWDLITINNGDKSVSFVLEGDDALEISEILNERI